MTSTHGSHSVHASHGNHANTTTTNSSASVQDHSVSYGSTLRSGVPDNTTSSSDPGTLAVLTAAINDIRRSWGMSTVSVPSSYAGLQSYVSGLSKTITKYQWGTNSLSYHANGSNASGGSGHKNTTNPVTGANQHCNVTVSSSGGSRHGNSTLGTTTRTATLSAPSWSTTPSTLLSNLNASKLLLLNYLPTFGTWSVTIRSSHGSHSSHSNS